MYINVYIFHILCHAYMFTCEHDEHMRSCDISRIELQQESCGIIRNYCFVEDFM